MVRKYHEKTSAVLDALIQRRREEAIEYEDYLKKVIRGAKKPVACLEYVVVHEMAHLIERSHDERFRSILDRAMPQWWQRFDALNREPLADEAWAT